MYLKDNEFVVYTNRSDTISISNGVLAIQPVRLDESLTTDAVRFGAEYAFSLFDLKY